jgi:hypothetical protein
MLLLFIIFVLIFLQNGASSVDDDYCPRDLEPSIKTVFIADITSKSSLKGLKNSLFRALVFDGDVTENVTDQKYLSVERMNVYSKPGLSFSKGTLEELNQFGLEIQDGFQSASEDPRIVKVGNKALVSFSMRTGVNDSSESLYYQRWMAVSYFEPFKPVFLAVPGLKTNQNFVEKNWAPFAKDNSLMFIYSADPLIVLKCDPDHPKCEMVYKDESVELPISTTLVVLRG